MIHTWWFLSPKIDPGRIATCLPSDFCCARGVGSMWCGCTQSSKILACCLLSAPTHSCRVGHRSSWIFVRCPKALWRIPFPLLSTSSVCQKKKNVTTKRWNHINSSAFTMIIIVSFDWRYRIKLYAYDCACRLAVQFNLAKLLVHAYPTYKRF